MSNHKNDYNNRWSQSCKSLYNVNFKTIIFKNDIPDHFPICIISLKEKLAASKYAYIYKSVITGDATEHFNQALYESDWVEIETCNNPSECYKFFLKKFLIIYKTFFQERR